MFNGLAAIFSGAGFMPHGQCYLWMPGILWTHVISDSVIAIAYFYISILLYKIVKEVRMQFSAVVLSFGVFIAACGLTHFLEVVTIWQPIYWVSAVVKILTAFASVLTGVWLYRLRDAVVDVTYATRTSEERRLALEELTADLEKRVTSRTSDLKKAVAARDEFLSIASHELKTPLTSMKLQLDLRLRAIRKSESGSLSPENFEKMIEKDNQQILRLTRLVDDMLDISRISDGKLELQREHFDLGELVFEVIERLRPQAQIKGSTIEVVADPHLAVYWDRHRIDQVVTNLLTNAIRYGQGKKIIITLSRNEHNTLLSVQDRGTGIAENDQVRIFERFERAVSPNDVTGLGLGLFISRQIVEAHGGKIEVKSELGQGSEFRVSLASRLSSELPDRKFY